MSVSGFLIRRLVTKDLLISGFGSLIFVSTTHLLVVYYIIFYVLPNKKKMQKFITFIKNNREEPKQ